MYRSALKPGHDYLPGWPAHLDSNQGQTQIQPGLLKQGVCCEFIVQLLMQKLYWLEFSSGQCNFCTNSCTVQEKSWWIVGYDKVWVISKAYGLAYNYQAF